MWDYLLKPLVHSEPLHSSNGIQNDLLFTNLSDLASIDHVAHQLGCSCIICSSVLCILNLAPQICQFLHISSHLLFPLGLHLLFFLNFILGPSPFWPNFKHICPNALGHYFWKYIKYFEINSTYKTLKSMLWKQLQYLHLTLYSYPF